MKLLLDQDVYAATARFLLDLGHDVVPVASIGLSRTQDQEILRVAQEQNRILVTRDRDFGHLVFVKELGAGVIYLRILPATLDVVHAELERAGQPHPKINHDNSSASYTWRPSGVGTGGSTRSMTACSGPMYCGGPGRKYTQEHVAQDLECRRKKVVGEPYEGKPHVRFEGAGNGNRDTAWAIEALPRETGRLRAARPKS
jgi:predicted nuclease of predicted toxin-antitoxin system